MAKELRFRDPDKKNPVVFLVSSLSEDPSKPPLEVSVHLEWDSGTYGTRVPVIVVKAT